MKVLVLIKNILSLINSYGFEMLKYSLLNIILYYYELNIIFFFCLLNQNMTCLIKNMFLNENMAFSVFSMIVKCFIMPKLKLELL